MKRKVRLLIWAGLAIVVGLASRIDGGALGPIGTSYSLGFRVSEGDLTFSVMTGMIMEEWEFFSSNVAEPLNSDSIDALIWIAVVSGGSDGEVRPVSWSGGRFVLVVPLYLIFLVTIAVVEGIPAFRAWKGKRKAVSNPQREITGQVD